MNLTDYTESVDIARATQPQSTTRSYYKPSSVPDRILFYPGNYSGAPFFLHYAAFVNTPTGIVKIPCTCDNGQNPKAVCVLHEAYQRDMVKRRSEYLRQRSIGMRVDKPRSPLRPNPFYAFNILRIPVEDSLTEQPQLCERLYWDMPKSQFLLLRDIEHNIVGTICKTCGDRLYVTRYICRSCYREGKETILADLNASTLPESEKANIWKTVITCPVCHNMGYPFEVIKCKNCKNPQRRSLFDQPVWIYTQPVPNTKLYTLVCANVDIDTNVADYKQYMDPFDFPKMFTMTPEEQKKHLSLYLQPSSGVVY